LSEAEWSSVAEWLSVVEWLSTWEGVSGPTWEPLNCRHMRSVRLMLPKRLKKHAASFWSRIYPFGLSFKG
jgi:hypothetical protein